jgi:hypothetical protein
MTLKFLALQGAPYIYDISRLRVNMEPIGCPETSVPSNQQCVTPQKSEDLIYTAPEVWNQPSVCACVRGLVVDVLCFSYLCCLLNLPNGGFASTLVLKNCSELFGANSSIKTRPSCKAFSRLESQIQRL